MTQPTAQALRAGEEVWLSVPWAPRWQVSGHGVIRGPKGFALAAAPAHKRGGYPTVRIGSPKRTAHVHVIVAEAFHGPRPDGFHVAHLDGDPTNNRADNLTYVSVSENQLHRVSHGTMAVGQDSALAALTNADVREIRVRHSAGEGYKRLAKSFGVTWSAIRSIIKGRTWKHVE